MKRFFIKSIILVIIMILIDQVTGVVLNRINEGIISAKPYCEDIKTSFIAQKVDADVLIIGSSTASHHYVSNMIADSINMSVYNCGLDGCFFRFQNCLIDLILKRYAPKIILWELGFNSLSKIDYNDDKEYQNVSGLFPYYQNECCKQFINSKNWAQRFLMLSYLYRYNGTIPTYIHAWLSGTNSLNGYEPIANKSNNYPSICKETVRNSLDGKKLHILEQTINQCKRQNVKLIVTASPQFVVDSIEYSEQYIEMVSLLNSYNIPIIDFHKDEKLLSDSTKWKDVNHMNDSGTKQYMGIFIPVFESVITNTTTSKIDCCANTKPNIQTSPKI